MTPRLERDLRFLSWSHELNLYAARLDDDANASFLLVHDALRAAFAAPLDLSTQAAQKRSLRSAIDVGFAASQARLANREKDR
ncbi:MAG TPA: hypothetical protein VN158_14535 [Caulobacter sp.]|nr:hypothetical protein [Caulobacter sp.]